MNTPSAPRLPEKNEKDDNMDQKGLTTHYGIYLVESSL